jgi:hypothetical protein
MIMTDNVCGYLSMHPSFAARQSLALLDRCKILEKMPKKFKV